VAFFNCDFYGFFFFLLKPLGPKKQKEETIKVAVEKSHEHCPLRLLAH
jgi:hypothetical protein